MYNKEKVYEILFNNAVKLLIVNIKLEFNSKNGIYNIEKLLCIASHQRYCIEYILNILYPKLDLYFNLDKFGRCRSTHDTHGRAFKQNNFKKELYSPIKFLVENEKCEVLTTPIYKKYKHYDKKVKELVVQNSGYTANEPVFKLLYKINTQSFTIIYNNIELTTFYYESDDRMLKELDEIPIKDRYLSNDINLYRAIYHTNPNNHIHILSEVNKLYEDLLNTNSIDIIKKIYWLLSHATLYSRGSAAITELLCSALLSYITNKNQIIKSIDGINLDIEAMISITFEEFNNKWDILSDTTPMNSNKYVSINLPDWDNKIINKKFYNSEISNINDILTFLENDTFDFNSLLEEL